MSRLSWIHTKEKIFDCCLTGLCILFSIIRPPKLDPLILIPLLLIPTGFILFVIWSKYRENPFFCKLSLTAAVAVYLWSPFLCRSAKEQILVFSVASPLLLAAVAYATLHNDKSEAFDRSISLRNSLSVVAFVAALRLISTTRLYHFTAPFYKLGTFYISLSVFIMSTLVLCVYLSQRARAASAKKVQIPFLALLLAFVISVFAFALAANLNRALDRKPPTRRAVTVVDKKHRRRGAPRNRISSYYVYVDLDGERKSFNVSLNTYRDIQVGDTAELSYYQGIFDPYYILE